MGRITSYNVCYTKLLRDKSKKTSKTWVNLLLFVATIITTMIAGAFWGGKNFFEDFSQILYGWKYSLAVLAILTSHEMGHYVAARLHKIRVTLPYYLPLPFLGLGTLGSYNFV